MSAEIYIFPSREPTAIKSDLGGGASLEYEPDTVVALKSVKSVIKWERMGPGWWFCIFVVLVYLWSFA